MIKQLARKLDPSTNEDSYNFFGNRPSNFSVIVINYCCQKSINNSHLTMSLTININLSRLIFMNTCTLNIRKTVF